MKISNSTFAAESYDNAGYCTSCDDTTTWGIEPDAEMCECEACGKNTVMGLETAARQHENRV